MLKNKSLTKENNDYHTLQTLHLRPNKSMGIQSQIKLAHIS